MWLRERAPLMAIAIQGSFAYVAARQGLSIVDLSGSTPQEVGFVPGAPVDVVARGDRAIIADHDVGVRVLDISQPRSPTELARFALPGAWSVDSVESAASDPLARLQTGRLIYVTDREKLRVLALDEASASLRLLGSVEVPGAQGIGATSEGYVFVAADHHGLMVMDVREPSRPVLASSLAMGGNAMDVGIIGSLAWVADYSGGLRIVNADPANLQMIASHATGIVGGAALARDRIFVAGGNGEVLGIQDPTAPTALGLLDELRNARAVESSATSLVAVGRDGLSLIGLPMGAP